MSDSKLSLAAEAYIYGYPLVYNIHEVIGFGEGANPDLSAPINIFGHARKLADHTLKFVSPNNDTLYSLLIADVTDEPLVLHLPDASGRYYVMQFVDAWTNNFAYLGRRATGTAEGNYLLAGPNWEGDVPDGMRLIRAPSNVFAIVGRWAVQGKDDVPNVTVLQDDTWVTPLSLYPERPDESSRHTGDWEVAPYNNSVDDDLLFWEQFRAWMKLFPPPEAEKEFIQRFKSLGLLEDESPYVDPNPSLAEMLKAGYEEGVAVIEANMQPGDTVNGWLANPHAFDYNLDYFEIGTISAPEWKIQERANAHAVRALAARVGLWGNHGYEATYAQIFVDDNGEQLNGSRKYLWHLSALPPVDAFWSLTMYSMPKFYMVDNPIRRYLIGDRTEGLHYNDDGSLDVYIQHEAPDGEKQSNWLPAPAGDFRPILRMYQPREKILDGSYILPPIQRLND